MKALGVRELTGQEEVGFAKTWEGEKGALRLRLFLWLKGTETYSKHLKKWSIIGRGISYKPVA